MPPQPLSFVKFGAGFSLTATGFDQRPGVAQGIAQCIASWSWAETQMQRLFVTMMGANHVAAAAMFTSLESGKSKSSALRALGFSVLQAEDIKIFDALLSYIGSQQKIRNKIAHWFWGISDEIPNGMVLVDPRHLVHHQARFYSAFLEGRQQARNEAMISLDKVYVYLDTDLEKDGKVFADLALLINIFSALASGFLDTQRRDELRAQLTSDARLAPILFPKRPGDQ